MRVTLRFLAEATIRFRPDCLAWYRFRSASPTIPSRVVASVGKVATPPLTVTRPSGWVWPPTSSAADVFARYGGEEFVALLYGASREEARGFAEAVRVAIEVKKAPSLPEASAAITDRNPW